MKKTIAFVSALAALCGLSVYCSMHGGLYGRWKNSNPQPGNIFDGDIMIEKVKNVKEGAQNKFLVIFSDRQNHALSCSKAEGRRDIMLCLPFLKRPVPITPDTTYGQIVEETSLTPLFLHLKRQGYFVYHVLNMEMSYITPDCPEFGESGCNYMKFPQYTRWGF